ncbi:hypothetical protein IIB79_10830 [candidate division KSB1 bacterium]|nr:hypothetical protein [candidate division KSB1 bacterium]
MRQVPKEGTGGTKEKTLIEELDNGAVVFQGEIMNPNGTSYLDRTTLTPLPDGRVHHVIETSRDDGKTWTVGFEAFYVRKK